jgi:hypothetical protein
MQYIELPDTRGKRLGLRVSRTSIRLMIGFVVCCSVAWICAFAWTAPAGIAWHALHGNYASFAQRKVPVPWDMWVSDLDEENLTITRQTANDPVFHSPSGIMFISRSKTGPVIDMAKDYNRLAHSNEQAPEGFRYEGMREFTATNGKGYCWESDSIDFLYVSISCWFDQDTLDAAFVGSTVYRDKFYRIVSAISGTPGE